MFSKAKKLLPIFIAIVVMISVISIGFMVNAASQPVFTVSSTTQLRPGDTFSVTVSVEENRGYCAGEFVLNFDDASLIPTSIEAGDAVSEYFVSNTEYADGKVIFATIGTEPNTNGGTIATVNFTVNENVLLYSGELKLDVNALVGNISVGYGLNDIKHTINNGEIHAAKPIYVPDADNAAAVEELAVSNITNGLMLTGTSGRNITGTNLAANFGAMSAQYFGKDGSTLQAMDWLTTGCKIQLFDGNIMRDTITVCVKADVNGDSNLDGEDAFIAYLVQSGALSSVFLTDAELAAADVNCDGIIDKKDVAIMEANGLLMPQ